MSAFSFATSLSVRTLIDDQVQNVQPGGVCDSMDELSPALQGNVEFTPVSNLVARQCFLTVDDDGNAQDLFQKEGPNAFLVVVNNSGLTFTDGKFGETTLVVLAATAALLRPVPKDLFSAVPLPFVFEQGATIGGNSGLTSVEALASAITSSSKSRAITPIDANSRGAIKNWSLHNADFLAYVMANAVKPDVDCISRFKENVPEAFRETPFYASEELILALISGFLSTDRQKNHFSCVDMFRREPVSYWEMLGFVVMFAQYLDAVFLTGHYWYDFFMGILDALGKVTGFTLGLTMDVAVLYQRHALGELFPKLSVILRNAAYHGEGIPVAGFTDAVEALKSLSWVATSFTKFKEQSSEKSSQSLMRQISLLQSSLKSPGGGAGGGAGTGGAGNGAGGGGAGKSKRVRLDDDIESSPSRPESKKRGGGGKKPPLELSSDKKGKACFEYVAHAAGVDKATACSFGNGCGFSHNDDTAGDVPFSKISARATLTAYNNGKLRSIPIGQQRDAAVALIRTYLNGPGGFAS